MELGSPCQISHHKEIQMQGKDTTPTAFMQLVSPILHQDFWVSLGSNADRYVKKLTTLKFVLLMGAAQLSQWRGLREISNNLTKNGLAQDLKLEAISAAQLSRKQRALDPKVLHELLMCLIKVFGTKIGFRPIRQSLGRLYIIDSTTISLCLNRFKWAEFRETKAGVKLHLRLRLHEYGVLPDLAVMTAAKPNDKTQMNPLVVEECGALNVFDRAYVDYKKFDNYCQNGVLFASRLKSNAIYEVVKQRILPAKSVITKDQDVYLGKAKAVKMNHPVRLIETQDSQGEPIVIVTNDFERDAEEIGEVYRHRWEIELFFKWIKQHFEVKHFYGYTERAVENQLMIALIIYCLTKLLKLESSPHRGTLLDFVRVLKSCLHDPYEDFLFEIVRHLKRVVPKSARRRRQRDHVKVYKQLCQQVQQGDLDMLYDTTIDPLFL